MATKNTLPIPRDEIKESFVWRDWFQRLSDRVYGSLAAQDSNNVTITGGSINNINFNGIKITNSTIDNTAIGSSIPSTGSFTSLKLKAPLAIAYGGTNNNATPTAGAVAYGTGTTYSFTSVGTTGQILTSNGSSAPTWVTPTVVTGYAAYHDTSTVTATSTTTNYVLNIGTVELQSGITLVGGTKITITNTGVYNFQFSVQLSNPNAAIANVSIWIRINGVDVPNSAGTNGVPAKHGSLNGLQIIGWNYILNLSASDYIELWWQSDLTGVQLITIPAGTVPVVPQSPSVIVTIFKIT
jgi:hypothetical protein